MPETTLISELLTKKILGKYTLRLETKASFDALLQNEFCHYFDEHIYFRRDNLYNSYHDKAQITPYEFQVNPLLLTLCDNQIPIALFKGFPTSANAYLMDISVVHPEYRRQGVYTALMDVILDYTQRAGFSVVHSTHCPSNLSILIAKMKKGFYICAMNISPEFGPEITLSFFHNETCKKAFLFRCGRIEMNQELIAFSHGSLQKFNKLLNDCS